MVRAYDNGDAADALGQRLAKSWALREVDTIDVLKTMCATGGSTYDLHPGAGGPATALKRLSVPSSL